MGNRTSNTLNEESITITGLQTSKALIFVLLITSEIINPYLLEINGLSLFCKHGPIKSQKKNTKRYKKYSSSILNGNKNLIIFQR